MDLFKNHRLAQVGCMFVWLYAYISMPGSVGCMFVWLCAYISMPDSVCSSPEAVRLPFYWSKESIQRILYAHLKNSHVTRTKVTFFSLFSLPLFVLG